jgi:hypothetical protein
MNNALAHKELFVNFTTKGPRFYYVPARSFRMFPVAKTAAIESIDAGAKVYEKNTGEHWLAGDLKVLIG